MSKACSRLEAQFLPKERHLGRVKLEPISKLIDDDLRAGPLRRKHGLPCAAERNDQPSCGLEVVADNHGGRCDDFP
eukprot:CAMPEP_0180642794 /NCGR_PEP_ID=MMETSP1037_2-20121125/47416_1 /TAXON_ID=632150 /ORGANISM="Azadinium spinosum, Strain 3D9" /LENGTH=75 /DNA_ID=CAMNT_0022666149 /DNA_START=36 /DNA_END=260 /DNA_ORIENTATION=+